MKIEVRKLFKYKKVIIKEGGLSIDLGLRDDEEAKQLALVLLEAARYLTSDVFVTHTVWQDLTHAEKESATEGEYCDDE